MLKGILASLIAAFIVFLISVAARTCYKKKEYIKKNFSDLVANFILFKKQNKNRKNFYLMRESSVFFASRFAEAFPGCRDQLEVNDPDRALNHLDVLLKKPLCANVGENRVTPIWWWRGMYNLHIKRYRRLRKNFRLSDEFLINDIEHYKMEKIIAVNHRSYFRQFVYVELKGMHPTGLYPNETEYEEYGEYYSLFFRKINYVTRAEYDDGSVMIRNKPTDIRKKVKLRSRQLRPYNFLIASSHSPINNKMADSNIKIILDSMLEGSASIEDLKKFIFSLPSKE